jgi:hypothetical protein
MTNEPEFLPSLDLSFTRPDEWPLYPALPLHRNDAEVGFLIDGYGFPPNTLILLNIFDPLFRRLLTHGTVAATSIVVFQLPEIIAEEGWSLGLVPGYGLEHWRDWDRYTRPCPDCNGRGYKGLASLPLPCSSCEASGTQVIR